VAMAYLRQDSDPSKKLLLLFLRLLSLAPLD
jgi:hypothetical protein